METRLFTTRSPQHAPWQCHVNELCEGPLKKISGPKVQSEKVKQIHTQTDSVKIQRESMPFYCDWKWQSCLCCFRRALALQHFQNQYSRTMRSLKENKSTTPSQLSGQIWKTKKLQNPYIWCKHHATTTVLNLTSISRCLSGVIY